MSRIISQLLTGPSRIVPSTYGYFLGGVTLTRVEPTLNRCCGTGRRIERSMSLVHLSVGHFIVSLPRRPAQGGGNTAKDREGAMKWWYLSSSPSRGAVARCVGGMAT